MNTNNKLTSFSSSRCASSTLRIMSSQKPWKLEIRDSCLSISVNAPKTKARVEPTWSLRFSSNSLNTSLKQIKCKLHNVKTLFLTYLNFSLMTSVCPSRARRISCVMHARLSVDLVCVLIVCNSSMISWICFRASSPVNKYLCNKIVL